MPEERVQLLIRSAQAWRAAGRPRDALRSLQEAASLAPDEPLVHVELSLTHLMDDQVDDAYAAACRAVALAPDIAASHLAVCRTADRQAELARLETRKRRSKPDGQRRARVNAWLAEEQSAATRALQIDPTLAEGHYLLSRAMRKVGNYDAAVACADTAGRYDIGLGQSAHLEIAIDRRQFDRAGELARALLAENPDDSYAHAKLAAIARLRKRPTEEAEHLVDAARAGSTSIAASLMPRLTELTVWPTYFHLGIGAATAFAGGLTANGISGGSIPLALAVAAIWATAWWWSRKRRTRIIRPLAAGGRARIRRSKALRAGIGALIVTAVGTTIIVDMQPIDSAHARAYLRAQECNDDKRVPPCGAELFTPPRYETAVLAPARPGTSFTLPNGSIVRLPGSPAITIQVPVAVDPKYAEPVITQQEIERTLAWWRYVIILLPLVMAGSAVAFIVALVDYRRVRV